ncbi:MAG: signal peptidase I [Bacilli bacterium]|nr:signal peptidase I [Bacilli bacterium]
MKVVKRVLVTFITTLLVVLLIINVYSFISIKLMKKDLATVFGYSALEVVSGSMEPTIHIGDLIFIDTKSNDFSVNDIVTFYDQQGNFVTHRIVSIQDGKVVTKGDNNNSIDERFSVDKIVGKCVYIFNNGGKIISAFRSPLAIGMIFVTGVLACIYLSLDKNGKPILTKEERELDMFKKSKKFTGFDENDEFNEFDEELDLQLDEDYDELEGTEEDSFDDYYDEEVVEDNYYEEEEELQLEEVVKEIEDNKESNNMSNITTLEEFRKYKEEKELEEFRRYKEAKELEEFRKYKEEKELEEFRQYEASMKKNSYQSSENRKNNYHKNSNGYKKYNKDYKKKN